MGTTRMTDHKEAIAGEEGYAKREFVLVSEGILLACWYQETGGCNLK